MGNQIGILIIFFMPMLYGMILSIFRDNPLDILSNIIPTLIAMIMIFFFVKEAK